MKIGLFIPCYIDQFYPKVGIATLEILEKLGCEVDYPIEQTCCGQPLANAGYTRNTREAAEHFHSVFNTYDYIVSPSGSCVLHVKEHMPLPDKTMKVSGKSRIYELGEFIRNILGTELIRGFYPYLVGIHTSCHGQRGLRLASSSEMVGPSYNYLREILERLEGITLLNSKREDECCGFGGTFSVHEEAISVRMGEDRLADFEDPQPEIITASDMSCLMHMEGISKRQKKTVLFKHFAEILNEAIP